MNPPFRQSLLWKYKPVPELVRLAWPIAVSMLSYSIMTLVDTLFVGRLGASALAAVGIGGVTSFTLICFGFGALRSAKVVVSQAVGAGRRDDVRAVVSAAVVLALGLGAIAVLGGRLVVRVLPDLVQQGHAGALAADYLWVRNLGAPVALVSIALKESRYGLGDTRSPMVATLAANVTNVALDAAFIWGLGLGVRGAAWATVAGYVVEAGLMLFITLRTTDGIAPVRLREVSRLLSLGLPMGLQFVLEVGSFTVLVALLARVGEVDVAAHQIALQLCHFSFLPAMALGEAASVLVGQAVGANEDDLVRPVARRAFALASAYTGSCALGFVLFAPGTTYPQHSHVGIEESYISVAGAWSENHAAVYAPGSLILNKPGDEHRITTGDLEPCLLAYAWVGAQERLAAPGMKLTASRKVRAAQGI